MLAFRKKDHSLMTHKGFLSARDWGDLFYFISFLGWETGMAGYLKYNGTKEWYQSPILNAVNSRRKQRQ